MERDDRKKERHRDMNMGNKLHPKTHFLTCVHNYLRFGDNWQTQRGKGKKKTMK